MIRLGPASGVTDLSSGTMGGVGAVTLTSIDDLGVDDSDRLEVLVMVEDSESRLLEDALELSDNSLVLISCRCSPPSDPVGLLVADP